ncbi:Soluble aldose sugar dehydrogenase YliI precursor [Planctomycetes bacterium CA13]|uniref:Soluble aldose sugar dehydrogenase YliI n=1 Tax=Novipirellula herctigrandis TaxID=2527986 RepID=A0A5C5Z483_9BACT|nr:Soluble aldose sugar dehydrogenase YliI precursor [Planctomycetes bacterium CA13]
MRLPLGLISLLAFSCGPTAVMADAPDANVLTESERLSGWELLFDGTSTHSWRNYNQTEVSDGWGVKDGNLIRQSGGAGDLITKQKFDAFELSLQYRISPGGNSGVMFHVVETDGPPWHTGPELQIQDNVGGHDPQKAGWLYQLYQSTPPSWMKDKPTIDATRAAGQWNEIYLRVAPSGSLVCLNGNHYYNFRIGDDRWQQRVAKSKFAAFPQFGKAGSGHICLQDHGDEVAFRNIKVRRLGKDESVPAPIHGHLRRKSRLAFPNLVWDQWEGIDDAGQVRALRLIELTFANDTSNRLFAASQVGAIWTFQNEPDVSQSHLFLDLRGKVKSWANTGANEQGLLGLAMHPEFELNGKFYVYYSHRSENKSVLSCFRVSKDNPNQADPDSEQVLLEIDEPYQNHNGGCIEFGPDGYLYVGVGDGGYRNDPLASGQDLSQILGKILRIDVDQSSEGKPYGIPSDNPFVDVTGTQAEIYAFGIRNPWRIAFDKETGRLWCGDVGQELWEEVDVIVRGGNYGWSVREGTHPFGNRPRNEKRSDPITPVWEYDHGIGKSITGGRVYRSDRVSELNGKYLYADYVAGTIWALSYDAETGLATRNEQVISDSFPVLAFGEDPSGEVYFLTNSVRGECIYRFE